ncbi:MAG: hypothetical protein IJZ85_10235 [Lachnospiraceae bacterium]|nr:hypothetical protein [Lachnospiraceae bacterium]
MKKQIKNQMKKQKKMKMQIKLRLMGWLAAGLSMLMLAGCAVSESEQTESGPEATTENVLASSDVGEMGAVTDEQENRDTHVTDTQDELYVTTIYKEIWRDELFPLNEISDVRTNGEIVYIRGKKLAHGEDRSVLEWRDAVISMKADGSGMQVIQCWEPTEKEPVLAEGETSVTVNLRGISIDGDGNLVELLEEWHFAHGQQRKEIFKLAKQDSYGNELWNIELPESIQINGMACAGKKIILEISPIVDAVIGDTEILIYNEDGTRKAHYDTGTSMYDGIRAHGEDAYILDWVDLSWLVWRKIDLETGKPGEKAEYIWEQEGDWIGEGCGYDFLFKRNDGIWGYQDDEESGTKLLDFQLSGINQFNRVIVPVGEKEFLFVLRDDYWDQENVPRIALYSTASREEVESQKEIKVTVIGGVLHEDLITEFNQTNRDYRVKVVSYVDKTTYTYDMEYETEPDEVTRIHRLKADMEAGAGADVLILDKENLGLLYDEVINGKFEDLYVWLDRDPELSRDDLQSSVLSAGEMDGKLYGLIPSFQIMTLVGKSSVVGETGGWTMEEMQALFDCYSDSTVVVGWEGKYLLNLMLDGCKETMLESIQRTGALPAEEIKALLELVKEAGLREIGNTKYSQWYSSNSVLLKAEWFSNLGMMPDQDRAFGETAICIGYPGAEKNGSVIVPDAVILMSADSGCKEGAWEFIRSFLQDGYQTDTDDFPVQLAALEREREKVNTWYVSEDYVDRGQMKQIASEEQAQRLIDMIAGAGGTVYYDREQWDNVLEVIMREAERFFAGEITSQQATEEIQAKVGRTERSADN